MPSRKDKEKRKKVTTTQRKSTTLQQSSKELSITMKSSVNSNVVLSSESDEEEREDREKNLLRKVSTKTQLHSKERDEFAFRGLVVAMAEKERIKKYSVELSGQRKACIKEGYLLKQMSLSFQRWRPRYFKLRPRRLFYAKHENSEIFDEIDLTDSSVAEKSTKKVNCSFSIIGPSYNLILSADSRKEMDEWVSAIKAVQTREFYSPHQIYMDNFSDGHNWYACTHNRPTYCNVCREVLSSVMNHGLSCDVCKFKAHKRCAVKATINCKWTTLATVGKHVIENEDGLWIPHQWLEGNLPVSAKCVVCDKTCGSVLRMQDWRCLWCRSVVHNSCKSQLHTKCNLGSCKLSIVPPTVIHSQDSDDFWQAIPSAQCTSPLLVFVNSKSGDNQGIKFLRRFRQFLNPAQVFDLMCSGPQVGLQMFRKFDMFRILICGGDGSVGWVLSEMDKLNLSSKAQVGVLPLGTGNDLAQVMGWGNMCDDDAQVPSIIEKYERASAKLLDRWSILTYEGSLPLTLPTQIVTSSSIHDVNEFEIEEYENTVANHLGAILNSDKTSKVVSSAAVLCETVKDFVAKVGRIYVDDKSNMPSKCRKLEEKLASLLETLTIESKMAELGQLHEDVNEIIHPCRIAEDETKNCVEEPSNEKQTKSSADESQIENINKLLSEQFMPNKKDEGNVESTNDHPTSSTRMFEKEKPIKKGSVVFEQRAQLMLRANSLKKAIRQIIEHTEDAVDEQNEQTRQKFHVTIEEEPCEPSTSSTDAFIVKLQDDTKISGLLLPPLTPKKSKSAPSTPTTSLDAPKFDQYTRQSSVTHDLSPMRQHSTSHGTCGLIPISQLRKSSTAINPLYSPHQRSSFLSRVLLANADALCAPATPLLQADDSVFHSLFKEKCVMNNYFGIGLDAKIALDFHRKREDNPKKCSRTKNRVWYGVLATKEFAMKTYKNLEQRIRLECDGQYIPLPPLQGIVVLNIPSYAGGNNFWGSRTADEIFMAPSYNDKVLEVVAVFSTVQLGMVLVAPDGVLQHHRIAQCRSVKITIMGDDPVPLQTDGEAWLQPPGIVKISHKNRVQMLSRDRRLEIALKAWEGKHRIERTSINSENLTDNEVFTIGQLAETAAAVAVSISESVGDNNLLKEELLPVVSSILRLNLKLRPLGRVHNTTSHQLVAEFVVIVRDLESQLESLLNRKTEELGSDLAYKAETWIDWIDLECKKIQQIKWLSHVDHDNIAEVAAEYPHSSKQSRSSTRFKFTPLFKKTMKKEGCRPISNDTIVSNWSVDDVCNWLDSQNICECREMFERHTIQGRDLLNLDASMLKDIGVVKTDHVKRILSAIKDLLHQ